MASQTRPPPPDFLSGSMRMASKSMRAIGETVGLLDSDDEEETKEVKTEEKKEKETPEDTLVLEGAEKHRKEMLAKKARLKEKRQLRVAGGATAGAIIGGIIMAPVFPLGMALGGGAGGAITKFAHKHHEKKKLKKLDRKLMAKQEKELKAEGHAIS